MNFKTKIIISLSALLVSFAAGRFLTPEKIKTEIRTIEVEKIVVKVEHKIITIHEKPDGSKETTEIVDTNTNSHTDSSSKDSLKEETKSKSYVNISVLGASKFPLDTNPLVYGLSIQKNVLGPITAGIFGLTDKTIGISLGLNL